MDAPLLALTRRRPAEPSGRSPQAAEAETARQLVQLRWIAVVGQLLAILAAHFALGIVLPVGLMLGVVALLALANFVIAASLRHAAFRGSLLVALLLDMAALTSQLYLSGGAANPFVFLLLLQVVLGAILLSPVSAGFLALAACASYALLSIRHWPLRIPDGAWLIDPILAGRWLAFAMVAVLLVLFITRISRNLRARDIYVGELAQRATEEEGIVRMGLFASGAAHELSTPLSSLSVLIADWQRTPAATDPAMADELSEAAAEVDRCKAIVSNILHSAGQARGEAMGSTLARTLVDAVADEWQAQHPATALAARLDPLGNARIAVEPALRQAIWSLLDNARDVSPGAVELDGAVTDERVVIAVLDRGPGFSETQLSSAGQLYQSTKGPGHGLGLFLAANVARQLGGSLEVGNRAGGGARVALLLPLVSPGGAP